MPDNQSILDMIVALGGPAYQWMRQAPQEIGQKTNQYMLEHGASPEQATAVSGNVGGRAGRTLAGIESNPVSMGAEAVKAANEGDLPGAITNAAGAALPVLGPAARGVGAAIKTAPKTAAALGGVAGSTIATEAAPTLTRQQQRDLEVERQRAGNAAELATKRAAEESERRLSEERIRAGQATEADIARKRAEADFQREEALRSSNLPFRQKYPNLSNALPFAGMVGALAAPYAMRAGGRLAENALARGMEGQVARGMETMAAQPRDPAAVAGMVSALKTSKATPDAGGISPAAVGVSAMMPAEAAMFPSEYDLAMLPKGDPNRETAFNTLTTPAELAQRLIPGALAGGPAAFMGSKLPVPIPRRMRPEAEMEGLIAAGKAAQKRPKSGQ